jgi:hypothetical protein
MRGVTAPQDAHPMNEEVVEPVEELVDHEGNQAPRPALAQLEGRKRVACERHGDDRDPTQHPLGCQAEGQLHEHAERGHSALAQRECMLAEILCVELYADEYECHGAGAWSTGSIRFAYRKSSPIRGEVTIRARRACYLASRGRTSDSSRRRLSQARVGSMPPMRGWRSRLPSRATSDRHSSGVTTA